MTKPVPDRRESLVPQTSAGRTAQWCYGWRNGWCNGGSMAAAASVPVSGSQLDVFVTRVHDATPAVKLFIVFGILLLILFAVYLIVMIRTDRRKKPVLKYTRKREQFQKNGARSSIKVRRFGNSAWDGAIKSRAGRDGESDGWGDDELPPITMLDARWSSDLPLGVPSQADLIAQNDADRSQSQSSGVYRTGVNPFFNNDVHQIEVQEVADLLTQAELVRGMGDYPAAIRLLTRLLKETEMPEPRAWLMLFDLYATTGRSEQYENLAKGFRILFNAEVPSWDAQKSEAQKQLEDYPRVIEKVQRLWGMQTCRAFLESLLYDDRGGERQGFMLAAYTDIIFLIDVIEQSEQMAVQAIEQRRIDLKLLVEPNSPL